MWSFWGSFHYPAVISCRVPLPYSVRLVAFWLNRWENCNKCGKPPPPPPPPPHSHPNNTGFFQVIYFSLHTKYVAPGEISVASPLAQSGLRFTLFGYFVHNNYNSQGFSDPNTFFQQGTCRVELNFLMDMTKVEAKLKYNKDFIGKSTL